MDAERRWAEQLGGWAIPDEIVAVADAAGRSPWGHPVGRFAARADADVAHPSGVSYDAAVEALRHLGAGAPGTVLDVGAGAGAASLPLRPWATSITAVDQHTGMLDALAVRAADLGVEVRTVVGRWPDVRAQVGVRDVAVCHHVVYDVADLGPFLRALTASARRRVVLEMTEQHPMAWMSPLWLRFHGLVRPVGPGPDDLVAVLTEGHGPLPDDVTVRRWEREERATLDERDRVALLTRRLCLPESREPDVAHALVELDLHSPRSLVTVTWPGRAERPEAPT